MKGCGEVKGALRLAPWGDGWTARVALDPSWVCAADTGLQVAG